MRTIIFLLSLFIQAIGFAQTLTVNTELIYKVNLPAKKSEKAPVIILLHGYGSNEDDLFAIARSFDGRFLTFSLRAPFVAEGQGYCWYTLDRSAEKHLKHVYKLVNESRAKILSFVSNACKTYKADSTQVFLMGFSQGSIMAYDIALSKPEKVKGVIALSGKLLNETKKIKFDSLKVSNIKFFIGHGSMDNLIEIKEADEAAKFLKSKKNNVLYKTYEIPHSINGQELNDIKIWLKNNIEKEKKSEEKK